MSENTDLIVTPQPSTAATGDIVVLEADFPDRPEGLDFSLYTFTWRYSGGLIVDERPIPDAGSGPRVHWDTSGLRASSYHIAVTATRNDDTPEPVRSGDTDVTLTQSPFSVAATLQRTGGEATADVGLWMAILRSARNLSFTSYDQAIRSLIAEVASNGSRGLFGDGTRGLLDRRALPFNDTDAYRFLKVATEAFMIARTGTVLSDPGYFDQEVIGEARRRLSGRGGSIDLNQLSRYLVPTPTDGENSPTVDTLPYLDIVRRKLDEVGLRRLRLGDRGEGESTAALDGILESKLTAPLLIELIWSYWHEEGMLVQSMNTISRRFQNIRGPDERDPLAGFETDPLRPLNNLLWGYIQDEQHRLTVVRRVYEYDHHYGITLYGKSVPQIRSADSRPKFLEAFHNLLYQCTLFFPQDDDTTVIADGFPVLNALKEVHLLLTQGAHNQYGDLPATARQEMLLQQWLLARNEFAQFLPTRTMVAYPERWMDRVDAMKQLQGWTSTSVLHFHNLAIFGEQILLGARYGAWSTVNDPLQAANWARFWRPEIQGYIHAYRAVTGVNLSAEITDTRQASERYLQPSVHLTRQLAEQRRGSLPAPASAAASRRRLPSR
ncbi:MAG TPA: hypothetical protein PKD53_06140 [Chloroflexaceae bacterium]|nr:hypothetical protein [Chloroflexaceae bacterium]